MYFCINRLLSCHDAATERWKWRRDFSRQYPTISPSTAHPCLRSSTTDSHRHWEVHDTGALHLIVSLIGALLPMVATETDGPAYSSPIIGTLAGVRQFSHFIKRISLGLILPWNIAVDASRENEYDTNSVTTGACKRPDYHLAREANGLLRLESLRRRRSRPEEVVEQQRRLVVHEHAVVQGKFVGWAYPCCRRALLRD